MIPKIINYCWFGGKDLPEKDRKCIDSWKKFCPDYKIIEWNESNYDLKKNAYMNEAYTMKKWGFVPDYARFDIIYNFGGIYLDTDVEIIKPIDELITNEAFMGFEDGINISVGIGFGAKPGNKIILGLRDMYENIHFINSDGSLNLKPSPAYITDYLVAKGLKQNNSEQFIDNVRIYPRDYFSPKDYISEKINVTKNTYAIHLFNASWKSPYQKRVMKFRRIIGEKNFWKLVEIKHKFKGN